ncbi:MAG: hypothetical protein M0Z42_11745 [Actinomycetota bacterium]|nr:hypothetical protein [Actinomycetota bacterium]
MFTERHLKSLAGFAAFLEAQREELQADDWQARYGVAHRRLTSDILPAFGAGALSEARAGALEAPGDLIAIELAEALR